MGAKPVKPHITCFLMCREFFQDRQTGEHILIGPSIDVISPQYPCVVPRAIFVELTSARGSYVPGFELRDDQDEVVWHDTRKHTPLEAHNPLLTHALAGPQSFFLPRPGRYELVFLVNEEEVARRPLFAHLPRPIEKKE